MEACFRHRIKENDKVVIFYFFILCKKENWIARCKLRIVWEFKFGIRNTVYCIPVYQYQWKSTVLCTKAKHKNMLINKHTIFVNNVKKQQL